LVKEARIFRESDGALHTVAIMKDDKGVASSFVEDEVVVRNDPAEVAALVAKYHARVLRQITVNLTSAEGKPLPPAHTTPRTVLLIDASKSTLRLEDEATKAKALGAHTFSSAKSANLAAIVAHERAAGHAAQLNFLMHATDFPTSSKEQLDQNGVSDAYKWPEFDHRAWQYVLDVGIQAHPLVAIIDSGFWLNSQGVPCGYSVDALCGTTVRAAGNSDLPKQFLQGNATGGFNLAGGPSLASCTGGSSCPWHGNKSASVALGKVDNGTGAAGTGGPVATPFLIRTDDSFPETVAAIEAAVEQGAKIISISSGGSCNWWCRSGENAIGNDMDEPSDAMDQGVFVVVAAGNDSKDAGGESFWPCIKAFCVGAMNSFPDGNNYYTKMDGFGVGYSNFGSSVALWAPTNIHAMPDALSTPNLTFHNGTSASAPYVAGVAALMIAVNPSLKGRQIASILVSTGTQVVSSAYPDDQPQSGTLIAPLQAVLAANGGKAAKPQVVITSPKDHANVGQQLYQGVTFTASVADPLVGEWPMYGAHGYFNWPFAVGGGYRLDAVVWTSSVDGPMSGDGYAGSAGTNFTYVFPPSARPGQRVITATIKNSEGLSNSDKITVDYEPQVGGPSPVIVYPPAGATFQAGTIPVRGYAYNGVNLGYVSCARLEWQQGIAATPIASTSYAGASGLCEAQVPFQAGPQTLRLTAKGPTGQVGTSEEKLTITPPSAETTVSIKDPTDNQQVMRYFGQNALIALRAFVQNPPASGGLTYTWSWYPAGASTISKTTIGTGDSLTWTTNTACGAVAIEVVVTAPSIPASASPTATKQIQVICSSTG
jgi:hypothetical protein